MTVESDQADLEDSESLLPTQAQIAREYRTLFRRWSILLAVVVSILVGFVVLTRWIQRESASSVTSTYFSQQEAVDMGDFKPFGEKFLELALPASTPMLRKGRKRYVMSGANTIYESRSMEQDYDLRLNDGDRNTEYTLHFQFNFENKDGQWVLQDKAPIDADIFFQEKDKQFLRDLISTNSDLQTLLTYIQAHRHEAFTAALKAYPMKSPVLFR